MASYFFKSSHYCVDEEEKTKPYEQPNQRQQNVGDIFKTIEIFPKLSVSSSSNSNSLPPSENQKRKNSRRTGRFSKKTMDRDKAVLKNQEMRILNTIYGDFDDPEDLCSTNALAMDGIFNYETYNAVLRVHNPDVIRATHKTANARAIYQMLQSVSNAPYVEEIDNSFTYEDLSVMRHPAELHQSLCQIGKEHNNTFQ
ncbi:hypothetical protein Aduo_004215 [Ancylostoma duodenale]